MLAVTQFESTSARRAFPCWDEPDLKAVFSITLVVSDGLTALANTKQVSEEPTGDGRRRVSFADTMPLSTYLVGFIVGDLEMTEPIDVDGVPLRVVHLPGKGALAAFAEECGAFGIKFFAEYFGIPYPSDKLDLLAIPDFAAGAMENLGLVTFREALLLVDPAARDASRGARHRQRGLARDRAHVVRRPRHDALVERPLAEGGVRHVHGHRVHQRDEARVARLGHLRPRSHRGTRDRRTREHPRDRVPRALAARCGRHVRRADLREGRGGAAHARAVPRRRPVPRRRAGLSCEARLRQHGEHRPVGRDRSSHERAGPSDHGRVDLPRRLSARESVACRGRGCAPALTTPVRVLGPARHDAVAGADPRASIGERCRQREPSVARRRACRCGAARPGRRGARQCGRTRLPPCPLRGATARPARRARRSRRCRRSSGTTSSTTRGRRWSRGRHRPRSTCVWPAGSATRRSCPSGRRCPPDWASATGCSTIPTPASASARSCAAWPVRRCTGSGGLRPRARTISRASSVGC